MAHPACNEFYLNLKTYSITFINCPTKIVQQKMDQAWESWKRFKVSWMGAWMGFAWGDMEHVHIVLKRRSQNFKCFSGWHVSSIGLLRHRNCVGPPAKTWHVSMGGRFQSSDFGETCFRVGYFQAIKISVSLFWWPMLPMHQTHVELHQNQRGIYNLSLK
jgi:hypothetical protein